MICRIVLVGFVVAYVGALFVLGAGTFGWFGVEPDPLSGVFLLPLGLPWTLLADAAPEATRPWLAVLAPALNALILLVLCGALRRRRELRP